MSRERPHRHALVLNKVGENMKHLNTLMKISVCLFAICSVAEAQWTSFRPADPLIAPAIVQPAPSGLTAHTAVVNLLELGFVEIVRLTWSDNSRSEYTFRVERCAGATCTNFVEVAKLPA